MNIVKATLLGAFAVLLPIKPVLMAAFVLTLVDMVFGICAAIKKGEKITSKGLGRTVIKIAIYQSCLICGFVAEKYLLSSAIPAVKLLGGIIGATEMVSILENADIISGNSLFASIIAKLQSQSNKDDSK